MAVRQRAASHRTARHRMEVMAFPDRTKTKASKGWSAGQLQALDFRFEARAKDRRVERVLEAITYECRIFIFDIQIELADVGVEEVHDPLVFGKLSSRQHHLVGAFLIELLQPRASLVRVH